MGRNRRSIGKARYANFKARVEQEYADELIGEMSDPLGPLPRNRQIPIRRGNGAMAMLAVPRDGEPVDPMEQLELEFKTAAEPLIVARSSSVAEDGERLHIPLEHVEVRSEPEPQVEAEVAPIVARQPAVESVPAPVIRMVKRTATSSAAATPARPEFSIRRFALGCLAGTGAAAMVLIALRALIT
jgi:hypothetical protein